MNVFELAIFLVILAVVYFTGKLAGSYFGVIGWILGCALASTIIYLTLKVLYKYSKEDNFWPQCKNCSFSDRYKIYGLLDDGSVVLCDCGKKYFSCNRRFMEISDGGMLIPYMIYKGKNWKLERNQVKLDEIICLLKNPSDGQSQ